MEKKRGAASIIKDVLRKRAWTQQDLANAIGISRNSVRNSLYADNMSFGTVEAMAEALGCRVVLEDVETGDIYR